MNGRLNSLIIERANMDVFFYSFLEENKSEMTEENVNTTAWGTYREKLEEYTSLSQKINMLTYYGKRECGDYVQ